MTGWKNDLVAAMDYTVTRLRTRIVGLSDEEYFWEPAPDCWTIRPDAQGAWRGDWESPVWPAPITTIAWRLGHIIENLFDPRYATHLGLEPLQPPPTSLPSTADAAIELVEQGSATTASYLASVEEAALAEPLGPVAGPWANDDRASFVLHILDELIHHGAEVALLRDLYRATRPATTCSSKPPRRNATTRSRYSSRWASRSRFRTEPQRFITPPGTEMLKPLNS